LGLVTLPTYRTFHLTLRPVYRYGFCVIKSFVDKRTAAIFAGYIVRDLPLQIQKRARAKLIAIDAAKKGSTVSASTINGGCVSCGVTAKVGTSRSSTTIEEQDHDHQARGHRQQEG
jgi:hypothetical protein